MHADTLATAILGLTPARKIRPADSLHRMVPLFLGLYPVDALDEAWIPQQGDYLISTADAGNVQGPG